jgi:tetratricopeptide (TPR) repeat protein
MNSTSFTSGLKRILPESSWGIVFRALRQDRLIWETLQGEFGERCLARSTTRPEDYSPAALTLLALASTARAEDLCITPMVAIESTLRQRSEWAAKTALAAEGNLGPSNALSLTLIQAGLLALELRERRRGVNSWESLSSDLARVPPTVLACLFGMISQPVEMLLALVQLDKEPDRKNSIEQALHVLLSQPLPEERQGEMVKTLLSRVPPAARLMLLQQLESHREGLAADSASWMMAKQLPGADDGQETLYQPLGSLNAALIQVEAHRIAGRLEKEASLLAETIQEIRFLQAELAAQMAVASQKTENYREALEAWERAVALDPASPEYQAGLVESLLQAGRSADAQTHLNNHPAKSTSPMLIYTGARLAAVRGDIEKARSLGSQAAEALHSRTPVQSETWAFTSCRRLLMDEFIRDFARLLLELDLPLLAVQAAQSSLSQQPNQPELLLLTSQAWLMSGSVLEAVQAAHLAVALEPAHIKYRRQLAECLEVVEDWGPALEIRRSVQTLLDEGQIEPEKRAAHLYALANCAAQAGCPEEAVQICKKLLQMNPNDGLAYAVLGEASSVQNDDEMALDHLHQAVQLAPEQAAPWLALARLHGKMGQPAKALETLQSATRAAPENAPLHLALGEAFLNQNALTQALSVLRRAADLAHASPSSASRFKNWVAYRLGQTLHQLGHLAEARQVLEQANHSNPSNPEIAQGYAQVLLALGDQRTALSPLEIVLQSNPSTPEPYLNYARSLLALVGKSDQAVAGDEPLCAEQAIPPLRKALELAPGFAEARALLAEALAASGDLLSAMEAYRQALDSHLSQEPVWQTRLSLGLGQVALKIGQIETAIASLQEANQADPLNPEIQRALSEAFDAAGLTEDALQAARAAILLAPEDIDLLVWFAEQALELRARSGTAAYQAQQEAISALNRAASIAPYRSDLLIRMGQIQIQAGDPKAARATFKTLAAQASDQAPADRNVSDLYQAAKNLLRLDDAPGAAACLDLALQSGLLRHDRRHTERPVPPASAGSPDLLALLTDLASARHQAGDHQSALNALDQAIAIAPDQASLYLDKADLHLEINASHPNRDTPSPAQDSSPSSEQDEEMSIEEADHIQSALHCLETALELDPDDPSLFQRAALIQRMAGDLPVALAHARRAIEISEKGSLKPSAGSTLNPVDLAARVLAAELARAQFDYRQARQYVEQQFPIPLVEEPLSRIDYFCLRAELSLESGDNLFAADDFTAAQELAPEHPRVLALQARLAAQRGDSEMAARLLQDTVESLALPALAAQAKTFRGEDCQKGRMAFRPEDLSSEIRGICLLSNRVRLMSSQFAVAEAAVELHDWERGLKLLEALTDAVPQEAYYQLRLARALVLRAEFQNLCEAIEVVAHAPGWRALSSEAQQLFERAIEAAKIQAKKWQPVNPLGLDPLQTVLRWRARGFAIFQPSPENAEGLAAVAQDGEDAAALVGCLRQVGDLAEANKAARAHPQHPRVLIHLSLALVSEKPRQALAAAHAAVEAVIRPETNLQSAGAPAAELTNRIKTHKKTLVSRKEDTPLVHALLASLVHRCGNRSGDAAVALQAIQTALSLWPDEPRWQSLAAEIYQGRGSTVELSDPIPVIQHLEQAVMLEPNYAPHYYALGKVFLKTGSAQRAIQVLEQAARLAPDRAEPLMELAQAFRAAGDLDQAASRAERAVTLIPDDSRPLLLRGEIALEASNPRGALSRAQAALRINPNDPSAHLLLARSLSELNRPDEALTAIEKALPLARDPMPFQVERARLMIRSKEQDAALGALQELAELYPSEPTVLSLLASCLAEVGQREAAIHTAQRALRVDHDHPSAQISGEHAHMHYLLGQLLRRAGQLDQAIHHLSEAVQHAPSMVEPFLELGHTHEERRQYSQALNAYQQATLVAPNDPRGYYHAGLAFKECKDYLSAESMLRKAASLAPDDLSIHRLLAAVVALNLVHNRREIHAGV